ncbi:MAG: YkgJ family cysteine cluster protein [Bryobacterales bacterium]|nr:YkgJ family cysteine cluster protein [Bryobacterales bacterium]
MSSRVPRQLGRASRKAPRSLPVRTDERFPRILDSAQEEARRRAGEHLRCRAGCFGCCIGPFPITLLDAARLQEGLRLMEPEEAAVIRARAAESVVWLRGLDYPGDKSGGLLEESIGEVLFQPPFQSLACPALDLESGRCELYTHRPAACRTYGPAIRLDGEKLPHCPLNYRDATAEQIEEFRVDIDTQESGEAAFAEFLEGGGKPGQTVIAFALS